MAPKHQIVAKHKGQTMKNRSSTAALRNSWLRSVAVQAAIASALFTSGCHHRVAARFSSGEMETAVAEDELPVTPALEPQHEEQDLSAPITPPPRGREVAEPGVTVPPNQVLIAPSPPTPSPPTPTPSQSDLPPLPDQFEPSPRPDAPRNSTAGEVPRMAKADRPPVGNQTPPVAQPDVVPPVRNDDAVQRIAGPTGVRVLDRYVARAGDRFELLFRAANESTSPYRIRRGDRVRVEYLHLTGVSFPWVGVDGANRSAMDRTLAVAPDGTISLPYLGTVPAAGKSALELSEILNQRYQQYYVEPQMMVSVMGAVNAAQSLQTSAHSAGGHLLLVAPDGSINFPEIGFVRAAGVEIGELERRVAEAYRRSDPNLAVSLRLSQSNWPSAESPSELNGPSTR